MKCRRFRPLVWLATASALVVAGCVGDDAAPAASTTTGRPANRAEEIAAELDCERTDAKQAARNRLAWWYGESATDCWLDGTRALRIHDVDPAQIADTVNYFRSARTPNAAPSTCPSGGQFGHYVVAGEDWVVVASSTELRNYVMDHLGGGDEVSDDGGPPASYAVFDPCDGAPSTTG